ncbi:MAG TPA: glycosyltransferase [Bacteroidota bacterium]|nr:glycosyltransferase [Bacteroidota bacterium]
MKILHVAPYAPVPPTFGGALRIFHLLSNMVSRHEVSLLAYGGQREYRLLRQFFGEKIKYIYLVPYPWPDRHRRLAQFYSLWTEHSFFHNLVYTDLMQTMINRQLRTNRFDIVQTEFASLGAFTFNTEAVKILDAHNVEYDNFRRMSENAHSMMRKLHYYREYKKFFAEEMEACRKHDAIFVTSSRDKCILDRDVEDVQKFVVPNGVDTKYFTPSIGFSEPHSIVFTGMMAYVPNYDGMLYFLDQIFPIVLRSIPDAKIYVVGNRPPKRLQKRSSRNVIITGYVDDVRPYVWRSSVYVVPLRMGGGTRLKIVEAMAMKKPIVTTSIGCEGIEAKDNEDLLVRDTPQEFADAVIRLLEDRSLAARLVWHSYEKVRASYDWSIIGRQMERLYQRLVNEKSSGVQPKRDRLVAEPMYPR